MLESNKDVVRSIYEKYINLQRADLLPQLVSEDYVGPRGERGTAGFAATIQGLRTGFPDIQFTLQDVVAEADRVAVRWSWRATHAGAFTSPFGSFPATGKPVTNTGTAIYQLADHKIVRAWLESDRLGALQQIGAVSSPTPNSAPPVRP